MAHWTTTDMTRLDGKRAVVTGANSGLGYQTAKTLAAHGAHVILACRDASRGQEALQRLRSEVDDADVELASLDLADLASVRAFASSVEAPLHILVNNAGVMALPKRQTADGFEMQFGTNHLGHFALTGLLLPLLIAQPAARVVTVSSEVHRVGRIDFDDLQGERRYFRWKAYGQSKLANVLFASELGRRAAAADVDLTSLASHPGYASTNLQAAGPRMSGNRIAERVVALGNTLLGQSDAQGAIPTLYAATSPDAASGQYVGPDGPFAARGKGAKPSRPSRRARDEQTARRLWDISEQLTGVRYAWSRPAPPPAKAAKRPVRKAASKPAPGKP